MGTIMEALIKFCKLTCVLSASLFFVSCASSGDVSSEQLDSSGSATVASTESAPEVKPVQKKVSSAAEEPLNQAIKKQNDNEIVSVANELLMINSTHLKALNALGVVNYKNGKYRAAEYFFNKALKSHPNESALYNNLGLVKLAQSETREAVTFFKEGLNRKSNDIALLTNIGSIYALQKDYANAEIALETVYRRGSKDLKVGVNYATALAGNRKYDEATRVYKRLLADHSSSREIMLNYSIHLVENVKDYKQGLDLISRLKFVGVPDEARNIIKDLENKAKAGLK